MMCYVTIRYDMQYFWYVDYGPMSGGEGLFHFLYFG